MEKKEIKVKLDNFHYATFTGSIDNVMGRLLGLKSKYIDTEYFKLEIEEDEDYDYDDVSLTFYLYGYRLETDEEYETRLEKAKKQRERNQKNKEKSKEKNTKREITMLKRLQKKYPEEIEK